MGSFLIQYFLDFVLSCLGAAFCLVDNFVFPLYPLAFRDFFRHVLLDNSIQFECIIGVSCQRLPMSYAGTKRFCNGRNNPREKP